MTSSRALLFLERKKHVDDEGIQVVQRERLEKKVVDDCLFKRVVGHIARGLLPLVLGIRYC